MRTLEPQGSFSVRAPWRHTGTLIVQTHPKSKEKIFLKHLRLPTYYRRPKMVFSSCTFYWPNTLKRQDLIDCTCLTTCNIERLRKLLPNFTKTPNFLDFHLRDAAYRITLTLQFLDFLAKLDKYGIFRVSTGSILFLSRGCSRGISFVAFLSCWMDWSICQVGHFYLCAILWFFGYVLAGSSPVRWKSSSANENN